VCTLTYVYADQTAVVGPLAIVAEPHCYDLCRTHAERQTAPRGWELVRFDLTAEQAAARDEDLIALAAAVRDVAHATRAASGQPEPEQVPESPRRRRHLTLVPDPTD